MHRCHRNPGDLFLFSKMTTTRLHCEMNKDISCSYSSCPKQAKAILTPKQKKKETKNAARHFITLMQRSPRAAQTISPCGINRSTLIERDKRVADSDPKAADQRQRSPSDISGEACSAQQRRLRPQARLSCWPLSHRAEWC